MLLKNKVRHSKNLIKINVYECCKYRNVQREINIQLVSDNRVEFVVCDSNYVRFPVIFYVEEPLTF